MEMNNKRKHIAAVTGGTGKKISIVTPCFNEEKNVIEIYDQVKRQVETLGYQYEHLFIDNASTDNTLSLLKSIAEKDRNVKIIANMYNVGFLRSSFYALLQVTGDTAIMMVADLQDPPELIPCFVKQWEAGVKIVVGVKNNSKENKWMFFLRKCYYKAMRMISETEHINNFNGFGLYDRSFIEQLKNIDDPEPYFRGLVAEMGGTRVEISYVQPARQQGKSSYSIYKLYNVAMLGMVNNSKLPLRLASFIGLIVAVLSLIVALIYFVYKLLFWNMFNTGNAPLIIGLFFFSAVQLIFIGIIGEYIGAIYTQVKKRPLVIEKERINF
jgi:glycosyltransferase involved in cell wall biosynthesis